MRHASGCPTAVAHSAAQGSKPAAMLDSNVHAQLATILPRGRAPRFARGHEAVRVRRPDAVPRAARGGACCPRPRRRSSRSSRRATPRASRWSRAARARACPAARCRTADGIVLSLAKFKRILAIDPLARTAVVQPGVRNLAISEAAAPYGLYYAPDPSSQIACTIGGNVAENAGGVHCLKYGLTVHNVRRVRGVLITGDVVEFGGDALDSAGLRPARADQRQRGPARRHHRDHGQADAEAAARAGRARRVRRRREGGRGGRRHHRRAASSRRASR